MNRLCCALLGAALSAAALAGPAEARSESTETYTAREYVPVTRTTKARSWKPQKHVRAKTAKRYAGGKKRSAHGKSAKRYRTAAYTRTRSLAGRSVTAGYSGGGSSRGCLSAPARGLLSRIESNFGAVQVISTCRPGARIAGTGKVSRHASGNAIDFAAGGRKGAIVSWLVANHHSGGTMTYRGMSHIHVDIGPRFVRLGAGGRNG
jgi:hypothetical protein